MLFYRYISENLTTYLNKGEWDAGNTDFDYAKISDEEALSIRDGDYDEDEALQKFDAFYRLVTGVLEKIKTNRELMDAIGTLGWHTGGEENE